MESKNQIIFNDSQNPIIETAAKFINSTSSHIFLTGKAGTGKTTFLKNLSQHTHKSFVVVAPTGIAALNAGGVTIHSQFLFPLGTFIPDRNSIIESDNNLSFYNQNTLARKHPLDSRRKQILRAIDLLVIDEVSMLRPDILDALDYRLKAVKGNFRKSFGGVQVLFIGDLFQLPPVVKQHEQQLLRRYYKSDWFFDAIALQNNGFIYIELDKIYRQQDERFIKLLNNLRNNIFTTEDISVLNNFYKSQYEIIKMKEVVTITTHNYKADQLNQKSLEILPSRSFHYEAEIEGDFPEQLFPVSYSIELKVDAQIMFIKNDSQDKAYFNGKLATVVQLGEKDILVEMSGSHEKYKLKKEIWENKRYVLNSLTGEPDEAVLGTFSQYPIKLAWAITVHKSQGLTFERAIIDVEQAFADGQVYVALSRLRSLEGLVLRSLINPNAISTDSKVVEFSTANNKPTELPNILAEHQRQFLHQLIANTFDFTVIENEINYIKKNIGSENEFEDASMKPVLTQLKNVLVSEKENTTKYRQQLDYLLDTNLNQQLLDRLNKGSEYYSGILMRNLELLLQHIQETKQRKKQKGYLNDLAEIDQLVSKKITDIDKSKLLIDSIINGKDSYDFKALINQRASERKSLLDRIEQSTPIAEGNKNAGSSKPKKSKKTSTSKEKVQNTASVTLEMYKKGLNADAIATQRGLVRSTIESHFAKLVETGELSIFEFMSDTDVTIVSQSIGEKPEEISSGEVFKKLNGQFSYSHIRAVIGHLKNVKQSE